MFARTSTWSGSPEALQKWADNAVSTVKGFVEGLPGNAGAVFLLDREGGMALTLTLWDSDDAAKATDQFAEQSLARGIIQARHGAIGREHHQARATGGLVHVAGVTDCRHARSLASCAKISR